MKKKILKSAGLLIILLLLGVLFFFPVYWTIITSFKTKAQVFVERPILWIDTLYLDNYIEIFRKSYVATFFSNSMLVAVSTTVISLALATMAGFGLSRYHFKGNKVIKNSVIAVRMIPALVYTIPYYIIYSKIHLLDTMTGLIMAYISFALPLAIWLSISFFYEIPDELYDSAWHWCSSLPMQRRRCP